jgi:hypothetical protein
MAFPCGETLWSASPQQLTACRPMPPNLLGRQQVSVRPSGGPPGRSSRCALHSATTARTGSASRRFAESRRQALRVRDLLGSSTCIGCNLSVRAIAADYCRHIFRELNSRADCLARQCSDDYFIDQDFAWKLLAQKGGKRPLQGRFRGFFDGSKQPHGVGAAWVIYRVGADAESGATLSKRVRLGQILIDKTGKGVCCVLPPTALHRLSMFLPLSLTSPVPSN